MKGIQVGTPAFVFPFGPRFSQVPRSGFSSRPSDNALAFPRLCLLFLSFWSSPSSSDQTDTGTCIWAHMHTQPSRESREGGEARQAKPDSSWRGGQRAACLPRTRTGVVYSAPFHPHAPSWPRILPGTTPPRAS